MAPCGPEVLGYPPSPASQGTCGAPVEGTLTHSLIWCSTAGVSLMHEPVCITCCRVASVTSCAADASSSRAALLLEEPCSTVTLHEPVGRPQPLQGQPCTRASTLLFLHSSVSWRCWACVHMQLTWHAALASDCHAQPGDTTHNQWGLHSWSSFSKLCLELCLGPGRRCLRTACSSGQAVYCTVAAPPFPMKWLPLRNLGVEQAGASQSLCAVCIVAWSAHAHDEGSVSSKQ